MLDVTDNAIKVCSVTVERLSNSGSDSRCLRLVKGDDASIAVAYENPKIDDELVKHKGRTVLAVPGRFAKFCSEKTLDINEHGKLVLI